MFKSMHIYCFYVSTAFCVMPTLNCIKSTETLTEQTQEHEQNQIYTQILSHILSKKLQWTTVVIITRHGKQEVVASKGFTA